MSFLLFDVEFIEKVLSFIGFLSVLFQCSMLTVLTLLIRSKNHVIVDFTEAKRNRQDAKNKCCTFLAFLVCSGENSVGFSLDPVVFCQTRSVLQPEFVLGKLMLGRLIKAPDQ